MVTLDAAINRAAQHLPDGWRIIVQVERGAGWVELHNADGARVQFDDVDRSLSEQVLEAVQQAINGNTRTAA